MPSPPFAVIDIGTNAIRLGVVQPEMGLDYSVLSQQKEIVRLGEGSYARNQLLPEAMDRALLVLRKFVESARNQNPSSTIVIATSAVREADNREEFLDRAREEAGVEVRVISGVEEARLIYLGVLSGVDTGDRRSLVIDIGGGSVELAAGDQSGPDTLESVKLGAIRMAGIFTEGITGPIAPPLYRRIQEYARAMAVHSLQRIKEAEFTEAFGSSGTIQNLTEICRRRFGELETSQGLPRVSTKQLTEVGERLASLPLEERRRQPGINPERADIIVAGAGVLVAILTELGVKSLTISDRALREGLVADHQARESGAARPAPQSIRRRSVWQLARRCHAEETHCRTVARLALSLFDQLGGLKLHDRGDDVRELLEHAAILHDVGTFLSYTGHHRHGYYLVRHAALLGFDEREIQILAASVLHHRKGAPKRREAALDGLRRRDREAVTLISTILRLAEALDRGHLGEVREVRCALGKRPKSLRLEMISDSDCQLALWGLANHEKVVRRVFNRRLVAEVARTDGTM